MNLQTIHAIADCPASDWNALFPPGNPFVQHEFLLALEASGSVTPTTGWTPCHQLLRDESGRLVAAAPVYEKRHSYGEFVFDFGWAEAAARLGQDYYPKGCCSVPFTPSTGMRIGAVDAASRDTLALHLGEHAATMGWSSMHVLFANDTDAAALQQAGFLLRRDLQFRFANRDYGDFEDYLGALSSAKRKKIRRERRRVIEEAGVAFDVVPGDALTLDEWQQIYRLYARTYQVRGQTPYLTPAFWFSYGRAEATPVRVVVARHAGRIIACALCVRGDNTLYGRHWGAEADFHSLHFETCYYQGIDYCIREGLHHFDAGTQGGHKLMRGFEPVMTNSLHRLVDPRLHAAVGDFLERERTAVDDSREVLATQHSAYRQINHSPTPGAHKTTMPEPR